MKNTIILAGICVLFACAACNKYVVDLQKYSATIRVANAIATPDANFYFNAEPGKGSYSTGLLLNYGGNYGQSAPGFVTVGLTANTKCLISAALVADTTKAIYNRELHPQINDYYTLFFAGTSTKVDTLLLKENPPLRTDSTTGVRFINVSPSGRKYSINILGEPVGNVVKSIDYLGKTDYISFPARSGNSLYIYELRDASTDEVLSTFAYFNIARFKNVTMFIRGIPQSNPNVEVIRVND